HREFNRHELHKIAILVELSRHKLPWAVLGLAAGIFDQVRDLPEAIAQTRPAAALAAQDRRRRKLQKLLDPAVPQERPVFLVTRPGSSSHPEVIFTDSEPTLVHCRSATFVNITEVLRHLGNPAKAETPARGTASQCP